jgi:hypothetical protein
MRTKKWYQIYGTAPDGKEYLLAKVNSKGNAYIVAEALKASYKNVSIK